ncbi:MAG: hypothetical protein DLM59_08160 [Pseudonocardiales bacterium]|nr:MAG: hypothetical protein DLM59_08160 [Pseudonocardiales bacterium]
MGPARRRGGRVATGLLPAVLLAACSSSATGVPPPKLTAGVQQDRVDATNRQISIPLINQGNSTVTVENVQLVAPQFTTVPGSRAQDDLTPGLRLNFPINFGTARCGAPPAGHPVVRVRVRTIDHRSRVSTVPVTDPDGLLDRLRRSDCQQQSLLKAVSVDYGPVIRRPGLPGHPVLHGSLIVRRKAAKGSLTVVETRGSVLFDLLSGTTDAAVAPRSPVAVLSPAADVLTVPVLMSIPRCDPHVLIEAKKVFFFSIGLRIGSDPEQFLQIPPPVPLQQALRGLFGPCPEK